MYSTCIPPRQTSLEYFLGHFTRTLSSVAIRLSFFSFQLAGCAPYHQRKREGENLLSQHASHLYFVTYLSRKRGIFHLSQLIWLCLPYRWMNLVSLLKFFLDYFSEFSCGGTLIVYFHETMSQTLSFTNQWIYLVTDFVQAIKHIKTNNKAEQGPS